VAGYAGECHTPVPLTGRARPPPPLAVPYRPIDVSRPRSARTRVGALIPILARLGYPRLSVRDSGSHPAGLSRPLWGL